MTQSKKAAAEKCAARSLPEVNFLRKQGTFPYDKKVLGTLGLAMKAGDVVSGEFLTEKAIREGVARLVIVAEDASANTKKKFSNSCHYYHVPYNEFGDKEMLGNAIGKHFRATLAVTDAGFAKSLGKILNLEVTKHGKNENI